MSEVSTSSIRQRRSAQLERGKDASLGDLCHRTNIFRLKLIEEFRLDASNGLRAQDAPKHNSSIVNTPEVFKDLLRNNPHGVIKFKVFKRLPEEKKPDDAENFVLRHDMANPFAAGGGISQWAKWLSNHPTFSNFIVCIILLNAIILGIQTEYDEVENWEVFEVLNILDTFSMIVFIFEILLKWTWGFKRFWREGWNVFDFFVTVTSVVPELVLFFTNDNDSSSAGGLAAFAKNLRILRAFRMLKMIAKLRSLRIIVLTIIDACQSLAFIVFLMMIFFYIFAMLALTIFDTYSELDSPDLQYEEKFSSIQMSLATLFQVFTLDQWYSIEREMQEYAPTATLFFFVWIFVGAFIFQNIFVGVMVRNFQEINLELEKLEKERKRRRKERKAMAKLQKQLKEREENREVDQSERAGRASSKRTMTGRNNLSKTIVQYAEFLQAQKKTTLWPRDTLFEYLQTMQALQENSRERKELDLLANVALYEIVQHSND